MESATASVKNCMRMSRLRARRPSAGDFAGALGDRHDHDVHDADAADHERHRCTAARSSDMVRDDSARLSNASAGCGSRNRFPGRRAGGALAQQFAISFSALETSSGD